METTLGRLRRLLGGENFVKFSAGQLSLNPLYCRVDSLVLEDTFVRIKKSPADQVAKLCEKAVRIYKGAFLPADSNLQWVVSQREVLKNGLLRIINKAGRYLEQSGQWEKAVGYYTKGIDTDILAEAFYQRLMVCYQKLGNNAAAVRTYHRCCRLLQEHLGIKPSAETETIYSSIIRKQ
jgi:DNA-binding SARP family transcriptional activator